MRSRKRWFSSSPRKYWTEADGRAFFLKGLFETVHGLLATQSVNMINTRVSNSDLSRDYTRLS